MVHNLLWGRNDEAIESDKSGGNESKEACDTDDGQEIVQCEAVWISGGSFVPPGPEEGWLAEPETYGASESESGNKNEVSFIDYQWRAKARHSWYR